MSRRAGHHQGFLCSMLQPTHLAHGKFKFWSEFWSSSAWCEQVKALPTRHPLPVFVKKLPLAQETTNNMVPLATFRPHQLWRQQHHPHCGHCTAAPSCTAPVLGMEQVGAGATSKTRFLGLAQGHPRCPPCACTILAQRKREIAQPRQHRHPGAL